MKKPFVLGLVLLCVFFFSGAKFVYSLSINKLIPRIRSEFVIPQNNVPDALLVRYLENSENKVFIEAVIQQIDYGNSIQKNKYSGSYAVGFFEAVLKKSRFNTITAVLDKFAILKSIWAIYNVYDTLKTGQKIYLQLADALCAFNLKYLAIDYIDGRNSGENVGDTWDEMKRTFSELINEILNLKKWSEIQLINYFEMYYDSWSLAQNKDGAKDKIREYIYDWLDIVIPKVLVSPKYGIPGTTFNFTWTDFKADSYFIAYLTGPNGHTIFENTIRSNDQGQATFGLNSLNYSIGTYQTWAVERKSGITTDRISFEVRENRPPSIPGKPVGPFQGYTSNLYGFTSSSADPEGHAIQFQYDWGDGITSEWGEASQSHSWSFPGLYEIKARARDAYAAYSDWSLSSQLSIFILGNSHTLHISSTSGGNTNPGAGQYIYVTNASVQINAIADIGYVFKRWVGDLPDGNAKTNPLTLIIDRDRTISAEFSATAQTVAWPMYLHDMRNSGQSGCAGPQTNHLSWTYTLLSGTDRGFVGTLIVAQDGTVYVGSGTMNEGYLNALDKEGNLKWKTANLGACPNTPAIGEDGTIYAGLYDFGNYFYSINPQDGSINWNYWVGDTTSAPTIGQDGTIYFTSETGYLYALNTNGDLKWQYYTGHPRPFNQPAISNDGSIFIYRLNYDWVELTEINPDGTYKFTSYLLTGTYTSGISISSGGLIYISGGSQVLAFSPYDGTGAQVWAFYPGACETYYSTPVQISNEKVVAASKGKIYFIDASTGASLTTYIDPDSAALSPLQCVVDKDGVVYTGFRNSDSVLGPSKLVAINSDGTLKWSYALYWLDTRPVISDGVLYIVGIDTDNSFKLYAFRL